jgi:hypothetical protein
MYKLYTDKTELFECTIKLEGASISKSKVRLVVESTDLNLLFPGKIDTDGKCTIPVSKLKGLLDENTQGNIKLEVIADDVYFTPWESNFIIETSKKLTVEVTSQAAALIESQSPRVTVEVHKDMQEPSEKQEVPSLIQEHIVKLFKILTKEDINIKNIVYKKDKLNNIVATYLQENTIPEEKNSEIISGLVEKLLS